MPGEGVDVDKCPSDAPTPLSTKTPTDAPTALPTKAPNCQFADGKPGTKCDGPNACVGIDTNKIGCGSCNGNEACGYSFVETTDNVIVGENSCNGETACQIFIGRYVDSPPVDVTVVTVGKGSW